MTEEQLASILRRARRNEILEEDLERLNVLDTLSIDELVRVQEVMEGISAWLAILTAKSANYYDRYRIPERAGVYLFSDYLHRDQHLYPGRTGVLRGRYRQHSALGACDLAYALAREKVGNLGNDHPVVRAEARRHFDDIRYTFEFRYLEEADPKLQRLIEAYLSYVLDTPYGDNKR